MKIIKKSTALLAALLVFQAVNAMAMAVPAAGSFAFDLYDIAVNQILLGPIGFVAGVACMAIAAIMAIRQLLIQAICVICGGAFLLAADTVVQTLGTTIS